MSKQWQNNYIITNAARNNRYNNCISSVELWQQYLDTEQQRYFWEKLGWRNVSLVDQLLDQRASVITGGYDPYTNKLNSGTPVERELRVTHQNGNYNLEYMGR